jgi:dTDP-3-amino-3,4,6-trideoxy-alpha-D-glucopyranose N,N-dimethyltransferase
MPLPQQTIFRDFARYYDLIYWWKDYRKEAERIRKLIAEYKRSPGNDLLEVACGTGKHARLLRDDFSIVATDANAGMLKFARANVKSVVFKRADMTNLRLGRTFDVVMCLFSSIGYVRTSRNLRKTIDNLARHTKKGGVVIIEPWFRKAVYKTAPSLTTYDGEDIKIARLCAPRVRGNLSIMDMHYLVAEKGKDIVYFADRHELGLFEPSETLRFMREAGLQARFLKDGLMQNRGLYVGVRVERKLPKPTCS